MLLFGVVRCFWVEMECAADAAVDFDHSMASIVAEGVRELNHHHHRRRSWS